MARPRKNNADWFSHDTDLRDDLKIKAVRAKYSLEGYAVYSMLLEVLADAENFFLTEDKFLIDMLAGDFGVAPDRLADMLEYFKGIGLLQSEDGRMFNKHLIDRMEALLNKRRNMRDVYHREQPIVSVAETPLKVTEKKKDTMTTEDFERFWSEYPIKEEKKKAREKFMKLNQSLLPAIIDAVKLNKTKNKKWLEGFAKHPTTWINGECWNDEITETFISKPSKNGQGKVSTSGHADVTV